MKALILAAGYATRLYPLTKEYPKPLLTVKDRPIIDYIIDKLEAIEAISEVIVVTNSKFIDKFREWASGREFLKKVSLLDDLTSTLEDRRGAIGDMDFAIRSLGIKEELLVVGGDNLFDGRISEFVDFARAKKCCPAIGVFDIKDLKSAHNYGVVKVDKDNKVTDFQEKPVKPRSTLVAMCLYYFPAGKLGLVEKYAADKKNNSDTAGSYINWLRSSENVFAFIFNGRWYDIGDHKFLDEAKKNF